MTTVFDGLSTHEKKKLSRRDLLKRGAGLRGYLGLGC